MHVLKRPCYMCNHLINQCHFQIKSFFVYEAVKTSINDLVGWRGYIGRAPWVRVFYVARCVLGELVVRVGGHFGEQGLPVGIQECLERFHRRGIEYLSR